MFERFTPDAGRTIVLADKAARRLKHNFIGTEHLLLGLCELEGEPIARKALESLKVTTSEVTKAVEEVIGHGIVEPEGDFPFTPRAKKVLELALREALEMGHSYISSSHILLALLREGEGVAAQVLRRLGLTLDQLRNVVVAAIEESTGVQIARHNTAPVDQGSAEPKAQVFIEPGVSTDQLRLELIRRICSDQVSAERLVQMLQILDE